MRKAVVVSSLALATMLIGAGVVYAATPRSSFDSDVSITTVLNGDYISDENIGYQEYSIDCPAGSLLTSAGYDYSGHNTVTVSDSSRVDSDTWHFKLFFTYPGGLPTHGDGSLTYAASCISL